MRFREPDEGTLRGRCRRATEILISAPFFSEEALNWICPTQGGCVEFWTRLNPYDWAAGSGNPEALLNFANTVGESNFALRVNPRLHAKIYLVDNNWAWIGSANLSVAAFRQNVELMGEIEEQDDIAALQSIVGNLRSKIHPMSLQKLTDFVEVTKDVVEAAREKGEGTDEDMEAAVSLLDELVGPEPTTQPQIVPLVEEFIEYLREHQQEFGLGQEVLARYDGKHNLQGHVKQTYYGTCVFLLEPSNRDLLGFVLSQPVGEHDLLEIESHNLRERWIDFLDANATFRNEEMGFRFSTLRTILPESCGGYTQGGGGAISTLKRVFPLTARFLRDKRYADA